MSLSHEKHIAKKPAQELMEFLAATRYEDLPPEVVERAKYVILDAVSCMLAGRATRELFGNTLDMLAPRCDGVRPVGVKFTTTPAFAAFLNGVHSQTHDFSDGLNNVGMLGGVYHPGRITTATALAMGPWLHSTGRDIITAVVLGIEVASRMRNILHYETIPDSYTCAAVAAKLMGANAEQMRDAIALAGYMGPRLAGVKPPYGDDAVTPDGKGAGITSKITMYGIIPRCGVEAAILAMDGFKGPVLQHDAAQSPQYATTGLGKEWFCMDMYFKPWPCCRKTHGAIGAALELRESGVRPEDIERIRIFQQTMGMYVDIPFTEKTDVNYGGQFSLQYTVTCALLDGEVSLRHYRWPKGLAPQRYVDFGRKITVIPDNGLDGHNAIAPNHGIVECDLKDGSLVSAYCRYPLGAAPNDMTHEQRVQKFRDCADRLSALEQDRILNWILHLEERSL